jgi:DNA polymerase-1
LDVPFLKKLSDEAEKTIYSLTKEIHALAEEEFNINSPTQLREILFTKLGLKAEFAKKTKTGFSTAAGELEKLLGQHPIVEKTDCKRIYKWILQKMWQIRLKTF